MNEKRQVTMSSQEASREVQNVIEEVSLVQFSTQLAFLLAIPVLVGAFIGWWLDQKFATGIVFVVMGVVCGVIIASILTVRKVSEAIARADKQYKQKQVLKKDKKL